jgi:hypothetical protein
MVLRFPPTTRRAKFVAREGHKKIKETKKEKSTFTQFPLRTPVPSNKFTQTGDEATRTNVQEVPRAEYSTSL